MEDINTNVEKVINIVIPECYLEHVTDRFYQITMLLGEKKGLNYINTKLGKYPNELEKILKT